jgi:hypothetical protein
MIEKTCIVCGVKYSVYQKSPSIYCSRKCYGKSKKGKPVFDTTGTRRSLSAETRMKMSLSHIGKTLSDITKKKLSEAKKGKRTGKQSHKFINGRHMARGYVFVLDNEHPYNNSGYVLEHRIVMEKHIGRYLRAEETVHHINEDRSDNRLENLMLFPNKQSHNAFHRQLHKK